MKRLLATGAMSVLIVAAAACSDSDDSLTASTSTARRSTTTAAASTASSAATTPATSTPAATTTPAATSPDPTTTTAPPAAAPDLGAVRVTLSEVAQLDEPIFLTTRPGEADTLYIAQRSGQLRALRNGALVDQPVLDISSMITAGGERGFLGFAFSPDGSHLYVDYTDRGGGHTNVDEYAVGADGVADVSTRRQVLFQQQPYPNHNGGEVIFGPDGYLYIGLGDGGSAGDPQRNGLNLSSWLGKLLRIDPAQSGDQPYTVPADNPFVGQDARPEIWSYGLRNPWRFSFDRSTNDLWIGDVGQGNIEEVDRSTVAEGAGKGVNFGWSAFEGRSRYNDDQPTDGAVGPAFEYTHAGGNCSVTGGYVYRGAAIPALQGAYLYTDYCGTGVRAIVVDANGNAGDAVRLTEQPNSIASFGEDADGEIYVCSLGGNAVYRIDPA